MIKFLNINVPKREYHWWYYLLTSKSGREYYLHTSGIVAVRYKNGKERVLKPWLKDGDVYVRLGSAKAYKLKHLVAEKVFKNYHKGVSIILKDKDPYNCDCYNLKLYSKDRLGKLTGGLSSRCNPIKINNQVYPSVRSAARSLFVSYQTLLDYMKTGKSTVISSDLQISYV